MRGTASLWGVLVGASLLSVSLARAADTAGSALTLDSLLSEVEKLSPELASKRAEIRAADERPAQARAFDDPMLMVELWQAPLNLAHVPLMFTLRQPIAWPGKLRARAEAVEPERQAARATVGSTSRTLRLEATRGYFSYRLAVRSEAVLAETKRLLAVIVSSVNARYRVGRAELTELLKAQEAFASVENELLDVAREKDLAVAGLNALLGRPPREPLGTPVTEAQAHPLPDEAALTTRALASRPELQVIQAQLAQSQARARAARVERAPDLAVWGSFMAMVRGGTDHTFSLGVQTSLPSWSLSKNSAAEREARAQATAEQARLRQLEFQIRSEVRAAFLRAETSARHIRLHFETLLPLSQQAVRAAQAGYQGGRVELILLLDAARTLATHHLEYERYAAEYGQRLAELEAAVGGPLGSFLPQAGGGPP